jgi:hypothetical protein
MATISTRENVFTVGYEARAESGERRHFESRYAPDGRMVFVRRLDPLSFAERWREERRDESHNDSFARRHGIYERISPSGMLAFLDKSALEENVFLNWRVSGTSVYSRVAIGRAQFLDYGHEARPIISDIVHHGDYLGVAWVRLARKSNELVFTRVSVSAARGAEHLIAKDIPFTTSLSAANIGAKVIVVRHTAILKEGSDSDVVPYFLDIESAI